MLATPHSWPALRAEADALGLRVRAEGDIVARLAEARSRLSALADEGRTLVAAAEAEGRDLTDAEQERLTAITGPDGAGGEAAEVKAEVQRLERLADQSRALALLGDQPENPGRTPRGPEARSAVPTPRLMNVATGEAVAVASHGERLFSRSEGDGRFGEAVLSMVRGDGARAEAAVFEGGDSGGNYFVEPSATGILLDRLREADVTSRAGVRDFEMTGPEMTLVEVLSDPTAGWRAELQAVPASGPSFGQRTLRAKSLACAIPLSEELLEDSANAAAVVEDTAIAAMALARARAILRGAGTASEPQGVLNHPKIGSVSSVGYPVDYGHLGKAVGKIMQADFPGEPSELGAILHPRDAEVLDALTDTTNQPLRPSRWVEALGQYVTTALPADGGAGSDESEALVGHFPSVLVGTRSQLRARLVDAGTMTAASGERYEAPSQLVRFLILTMRMDVLVLRPSWFVGLSGLLAVDPGV